MSGLIPDATRQNVGLRKARRLFGCNATNLRQANNSSSVSAENGFSESFCGFIKTSHRRSRDALSLGTAIDKTRTRGAATVAVWHRDGVRSYLSDIWFADVSAWEMAELVIISILRERPHSPCGCDRHWPRGINFPMQRTPGHAPRKIPVMSMFGLSAAIRAATILKRS